MKKAVSMIIAILFAVSVCGAALAAAKVKVKQITGDVAAVDAAAKSLTVKGRSAEVVVSADDKTTVKMDKEKKSLSDVKVGDRVTVKYSESDGKNIARNIEIKPAKAAAPAKPAPAKPGY